MSASRAGRLWDYHIHLEKGRYEEAWVHEFLSVALALDEIGFSEHGHRFLQARDVVEVDWARERCTENVEDYVRLIEGVREQAAPRLRIRLGLEMDFVPGKEREIERFISSYPWEYVIGSVHWDGEFPLDDLSISWEGRDIWGIYARYFALVKEMARSGLRDRE